MGSLQSAPMEPPSPARLYAALVGAALFVAGVLGFFQDLSWLNYLHLGSGALALLLAGRAARFCALGLGTLYTGLAIWDFSSAGWPHLALGLLGLAAFAATAGKKGPKRGRPSKRALKPRAQAAGKSP
jgi:membrane protein implicated in regulation of membrane protease activity